MLSKCVSSIKRTSESNGLAHPTQEQALAEYQRIWSWLDGRNIEDLIELPLMNDPGNTQYFRCPDRGRAAGPVYRP